MQTRCKCCGQTVDAGDIEAIIASRNITETQAIIFRELAKAKGSWMQHRALSDAVYSHRYDGGPDDAQCAVNQHICYLKKKIIGTPYRIEGRRGEFGGHRLVRVSIESEAA